jgi:sugar transferase (PEP-CTERM/EpsH1 system associated)
MNVLFVVPYVPSLIRVRPFNLIRYLSARGHRVTVATLWTDKSEIESIDRLQENCARVNSVYMPGWRSMWNCLRALPSGDPLQTVYSWEPELARWLASMLSHKNGYPEDFDVIHVEHLRGARYGLFLKSQFRSLDLPIVWDSVDSISLLFRQAMVQSKSVFSRGLTRFELGRTESFEARLVKQFDRVLVTSSTDKQSFLALEPGLDQAARISVLPNGVDLDYFRPDEKVEREPATLVVSGKMSYHANVAMVMRLVNEIMPHVWKRRPDVKILVVGKDPPRQLQSLSQDPRIIVTGTVNDLRPYLQKATIAVAPIVYSAGIQNKVLEALACSTPVIASPQAVSALELIPGQDLCTAEKPDEFANSILALLSDPERRKQLGKAGREYVESHHRWFSIVEKLEQIYEQAIQSKRSGFRYN